MFGLTLFLLTCSVGVNAQVGSVEGRYTESFAIGDAGQEMIHGYADVLYGPSGIYRSTTFFYVGCISLQVLTTGEWKQTGDSIFTFNNDMKLQDVDLCNCENETNARNSAENFFEKIKKTTLLNKRPESKIIVDDERHLILQVSESKTYEIYRKKGKQ